MSLTSGTLETADEAIKQVINEHCKLLYEVEDIVKRSKGTVAVHVVIEGPRSQALRHLKFFDSVILTDKRKTDII